MVTRTRIGVMLYVILPVFLSQFVAHNNFLPPHDRNFLLLMSSYAVKNLGIDSLHPWKICSYSSVTVVIKYSSVRWVGLVACMDVWCSYTIFVQICERKRHIGKPACRWSSKVNVRCKGIYRLDPSGSGQGTSLP